MKLLGYSPYAHPGTCFPFDAVFDKEARLDYAPARNCKAILLWGGTDINPKLYKEEAHAMNGYVADSKRDTDEWAWIKDAIAANTPIIGVCRGAQMLCAAAGGKLYQHIYGHHSEHAIKLREGTIIMSSSSHHQMMDLSGLTEGDDYIMLADSDDYAHIGQRNPEVVWFPKIRGLAIQGHPEWHTFEEPFVQWVLLTVIDMLENKLF